MSKKDDCEVLYVHPYTTMPFQSIIPISLPALIQRIKFPVRGYYAAELGKEQIRTAKIIIIDIHWYASLRGAKRLIKKVKNINPRTIIIAGGLTATAYAHILIKEMGIDYIIRGDAEVPLPKLIAALLASKKNLADIPNLIGRNGLETDWSYKLSEKDINQNDYYNIDFFPSLKKDVQKMHSRHTEWPLPVYPFLLPFRGCKKKCLNCIGAPQEQKKYFCRTSVTRNPLKIAADLAKLDKTPYLRYVNIYLDFLTQRSFKFVRTALPKRLKLKVFYEFSSLPSEQIMKYFLSHFSGGVIYFSIDNYHSTSTKITNLKKLIKMIKVTQRYKNYTPILYWSSTYARAYKHYYEAVLTVVENTGCSLSDSSYFWIDAPSFGANRQADMKQYRFYYKMSSGYYLLINNFSMRIIYYLGYIIPGSWIKKLRIILCRLLYNLPFRINASLKKIKSKKIG